MTGKGEVEPVDKFLTQIKGKDSKESLGQGRESL